MVAATEAASEAVVIGLDGLAALIGELSRRGFRVIGPTVGDGAIVYNDVASPADLPAGWTDRQEAGQYRLERRADGALFGYAVGPQAWKRFLHPPLLSLWRAERTKSEMTVQPADAPAERFAFLGVRACELHAIAIQDRVFLHGPHIDPHYQARRADAFIIAVNCGEAGGTCFCASMHTGPKAEAGFDLALTELPGENHRFLVETGSARGAEVIGAIPHRPAAAEDHDAAAAAVTHAAASMGRTMPVAAEVPDLLRANLEHPRWNDVAGRCLTCGNCTMVCPTCFCTTVTDSTDLAGQSAERTRRWDSCFTMDFSYIHGGSVRASPRSRYRQWMTHKLAHWVDQFGTSGCVGCGRCITWCPVGIDITEEVGAIRATPAKTNGGGHGGA